MKNKLILLILILILFFSCSDKKIVNINKIYDSTEVIEEPIKNKDKINGVVAATSRLNIKEKPSTRAAVIAIMTYGSIFELIIRIKKLEELMEYKIIGIGLNGVLLKDILSVGILI
jgi:hypothetical protein